MTSTIHFNFTDYQSILYFTGVWRILNMAQIERKRISVYARGATPTRTSERVSPCSSSWYTIRPNCSLFSVAYTSV